MAHANSSGPPPLTASDFALYQSAPENMRVRALITFAKSGQQEQAAELLLRFPLQGPMAANRTLFVEGLILEGRGDLFGAAKKFRTALANDPKLSLVRSELAQVLIALDETDSAKHHLRLLEADAPSATDAAGIRSFIDKIDDRRPYSISSYFSLAPTTNVNNGSSHSTISSPGISTFAPDINTTGIIINQQQSGLGLSGGLNLGFNKRLDDRFQLVLGGGVDGRAYIDAKYDSISTSQSAEIRYLISDGYLSFGGIASQGFSPSTFSLNYHSYGPRVAASIQISQRDLINSNLSYEWRDYGSGASLNGTALHTDTAWTHAIDSSMNVTLFGGYDKVKSVDPAISYSTYFGGMNFYKELTMGLTIDASAQARISPFDAPDLVTTLTRFDKRYVGSLTLTKRDLNLLGFAPSINYTYTLNRSNVAFFDYDSHAVNFSLTRDF